MITPSGVTRANVRPVSCDAVGVVDVVGLFDPAPIVARPSSLQGFAVTNSPNASREKPTTMVSRPITRRFRNPPS